MSFSAFLTNMSFFILNVICKVYIYEIYISYIYLEWNFLVDVLASLGLTLNDSTNWNIISIQIGKYFVWNNFGLSNFRFLNFWKVLALSPVFSYCIYFFFNIFWWGKALIVHFWFKNKSCWRRYISH